jgi:hypothetical protein
LYCEPLGRGPAQCDSRAEAGERRDEGGKTKRRNGGKKTPEKNREQKRNAYMPWSDNNDNNTTNKTATPSSTGFRQQQRPCDPAAGQHYTTQPAHTDAGVTPRN